MIIEQVANLIKDKLPNYASLAECEFNKLYNHQWHEKKYSIWERDLKGSPLFSELKNRYGNVPFTRTMIIDLFKSGKWYDGFLCAMIWGNIGVHNRNKTLDSIFCSKTQQCVNGVIYSLQQGNIQDAYISLLPGNTNYIDYVGESFFTKLLYFAGASISELLLIPQPLIFDNIMKDVYREMTGSTPKNCDVDTYLEYCQKMEEIRNLLYLPTAGHVEALLFSPGIRMYIYEKH